MYVYGVGKRSRNRKEKKLIAIFRDRLFNGINNNHMVVFLPDNKQLPNLKNSKCL